MQNSNFINSGIVGKTYQDTMRQINEEVVSKWDSIGFLKGLQGHNRDTIARLYENTVTNLQENTGAGSSGSFETVVFPIVRRIFNKLLANDIVSVQAMNLPIGKLFYFVPKVSSRYDENGTKVDNPWVGNPTGTTFSHTSMAHGNLPDCVVGQDCEMTEFQCKNLYDLFYDDGLFDASKGELTINALTANPVQLSADGCEFLPLVSGKTANDGSVRYMKFAASGFSSVGKGRLTGPDGNEMDSESFLSTLNIVTNVDIIDPDGNVIYATGDKVDYRMVTQKYGKGIVAYNDICDDEGNIYVEVDLSHPVAADGTKTDDGYVGAEAPFVADDTTFTISYGSYATLEFETEMGEVSFDLEDVVVSVQERKLRAVWSPELAQDVDAFHNINAEAELTALLSEQVAGEIDREILRDLRNSAPWKLDWDYNGWRKASNAANPYTQKEWNQTLMTKALQIDAQIHKATLKGGVNFIVVSSEGSAVFNDLNNYFASDASAESDTYNMGIEKIGTLGGRFTVYRDPYSPANQMLLGHKGKSLLDTGYIYAPYVPLQLTPVLTNYNNFANVRGIMTRYAKKVVNSRFYGKVRMDGIPTFDTRELR